MFGNQTTDEVAAKDSWNSPYHPVVQLLGWLLAGALTLETVIGNAMVMIAYWLSSGISKQISNRFIVSLAISDLIIGIEGIPLFTVYVINGDRWPLGGIACETWLFLDYTLCLVSILTVLLITTDRYLSVCHTASYLKWQTPLKIQLLIVGSWVLPAIVFGIMIYGWEWLSGESNSIEDGECYAPFLSNPYVNMSMYLAYYWTTLVAMLILYKGIHKVAKKLEKKSRAKEHRHIALLLTQRLGTQVCVGIMLHAKKYHDEAMLAKADDKDDIKDSGYNTNNTLSTTLTSLPSDARRRSSCLIQTPPRQLRSGNELTKLLHEIVPLKEVSDENCQSDDKPEENVFEAVVPVENVDTDADEEEEDIVILRSLSLSTIAFEEGSLGSVIRFSSPFSHQLSDQFDPAASENTSIIVLKNMFQKAPSDKRPQFSSLKINYGHKIANEKRSKGGSLREVRKKLSKRFPHNNYDTSQTNNVPSDVVPIFDSEMFPKQMLSSSLGEGQSSSVHPLEDVRSRAKSSAHSTSTVTSAPHSHKLLAVGEIPTHYRRRSSAIRGTNNSCRPSFQVSELENISKPRRFLQPLFRHLSQWMGATRKTGDTANVHSSNEWPHPTRSFSTSSSLSSSEAEIPTSFPLVVPAVTITREGTVARVCRPSIESVASKGRNSTDREGRESFEATLRLAAMMKNTSDRFLHSVFAPITALNRRRKKTKAERRAHKAFRTITFIVGLFAILWSPYYVVATIYGFCKGQCIPSFLYNLSYYMCYLNSSGNPFAYALANRQFRTAFIRILKGNLRKS